MFHELYSPPSWIFLNHPRINTAHHYQHLGESDADAHRPRHAALRCLRIPGTDSDAGFIRLARQCGHDSGGRNRETCHRLRPTPYISETPTRSGDRWRVDMYFKMNLYINCFEYFCFVLTTIKTTSNYLSYKFIQKCIFCVRQPSSWEISHSPMCGDYSR